MKEYIYQITLITLALLTNCKSDNKVHVEKWFNEDIDKYKIDEEHYNYTPIIKLQTNTYPI